LSTSNNIEKYIKRTIGIVLDLQMSNNYLNLFYHPKYYNDFKMIFSKSNNKYVNTIREDLIMHNMLNRKISNINSFEYLEYYLNERMIHFNKFFEEFFISSKIYNQNKELMDFNYHFAKFMEIKDKITSYSNRCKEVDKLVKLIFYLLLYFKKLKNILSQIDSNRQVKLCLYMYIKTYNLLCSRLKFFLESQMSLPNLSFSKKDNDFWEWAKFLLIKQINDINSIIQEIKVYNEESEKIRKEAHSIFFILKINIFLTLIKEVNKTEKFKSYQNHSEFLDILMDNISTFNNNDIDKQEEILIVKKINFNIIKELTEIHNFNKNKK
jgi:hypothetical protein